MPTSPLQTPSNTSIQLSRSSAARVFIGGTLVIAVLSYASHLIQLARGGGSIALFDVGDEVSIGTWFETVQFLVAAIAVASLVRTGVTAPHLVNRVRLLAVVLFVLSIDESVSLHERLGSALRDVLSTSGYLYYIWVIPAVIFALLLALWEVPWLRSLPLQTRS